MYVTRPLSMYKKFPSALSLRPPEGPNSGVLVIQDEESDPTCLFGLFNSNEVRDLPFPQNINLKLQYMTTIGPSAAGQPPSQHVLHFYATFIPVLNHPLSSNRYYAIQTQGSHKGEAYASSKEEDMGTCFCFNYVRDVPPKPLDPNNVYQQFKICHGNKTGGFVAESVSPDGFPPEFLSRRGWEVRTSTPRDFKLGDAPGLDIALRARLPGLNFPLSNESSQPVIVGKWYSPFMFIREGTLADQMSRSMYYEITLEQRWERVFACERNDNQGNAVVVDAVVEREVVSIAGREAADVKVVEGVMWFRSFSKEEGERRAGLNLVVVKRMKWEQERAGWVGGKEKQVTLKRVEEFGGTGKWRKFGFYVLVERYVVKRMDGSPVLAYDFKHFKQTRGKWELNFLFSARTL